jgi:predicted RNA-binding protein YlxR (DUF448 family)
MASSVERSVERLERPERPERLEEINPQKRAQFSLLSFLTAGEARWYRPLVGGLLGAGASFLFLYVLGLLTPLFFFTAAHGLFLGLVGGLAFSVSALYSGVYVPSDKIPLGPFRRVLAVLLAPFHFLLTFIFNPFFSVLDAVRYREHMEDKKASLTRRMAIGSLLFLGLGVGISIVLLKHTSVFATLIGTFKMEFLPGALSVFILAYAGALLLSFLGKIAARFSLRRSNVDVLTSQVLTSADKKSTLATLAILNFIFSPLVTLFSYSGRPWIKVFSSVGFVLGAGFFVLTVLIGTSPASLMDLPLPLMMLTAYALGWAFSMIGRLVMINVYGELSRENRDEQPFTTALFTEHCGKALWNGAAEYQALEKPEQQGGRGEAEASEENDAASEEKDAASEEKDAALEDPVSEVRPVQQGGERFQQRSPPMQVQLLSPVEAKEGSPSAAATTFFAAPLPDHAFDQNHVAWRAFLIQLLQCVRKNADGHVIGIDTEKRRGIILEMLRNNAMRFPAYMQTKDAGNIVISIDDDKRDPSEHVPKADIQRLKAYGPKPGEPKPDRDLLRIQECLGSMKILQNVQYDSNNKLIGRGLYGGLSREKEKEKEKVNRTDVAFDSLQYKLAKALPQKLSAQHVSTLRKNTKLLSYSSHDIYYLVNSFLPTEAFLKDIGPEFLDENVRAFYQNKPDQRSKHDPKSLSLAVSNTYHLPLTGEQFDEMSVNDRQSFDINGIGYKAEVRPLLACLYPQDYKYRHEFYVGILPLLSEKLHHDVSLLQRTLVVATDSIIDRMLTDIENKNLPEELTGLEAPNAAYFWKSSIEINFATFMKQYPGMGWETILGMMKLDGYELSNLDVELENVWRRRMPEILGKLEMLKAQAQAQAHGELREDKEAEEERTAAILEKQQREAITALISDEISFGEFNGMPLIAFDTHVYEKASYDKSMTLSPNSPYTREDLSQYPLFEFKPLHDLVNAYQSDRPISDEFLKSLATLSRDMINGEMMTSPKIAIVEIKYDPDDPKKHYRLMICDEKTLRQNPPPEGGVIRILAQRDFSELGDVIRLMRRSIEPHYVYEPTNLCWDNLLIPQSAYPILDYQLPAAAAARYRPAAPAAARYRPAAPAAAAAPAPVYRGDVAAYVPPPPRRYREESYHSEGGSIRIRRVPV